MRFSVAAVAGLAAGVSANYNYTSPPVYTTEVVTAYTTYCPGPTSITYGSSTYTVTEATTLTITDCPCTVTYPVTTPTTYAPPTTYVPPVTSATYVPPPVYTPPPANTSVPVPPPTYTTPPVGAANRAVVASGAGLAAVFGFVAYVL